MAGKHRDERVIAEELPVEPGGLLALADTVRVQLMDVPEPDDREYVAQVRRMLAEAHGGAGLLLLDSDV
jgi:hypothetical protein